MSLNEFRTIHFLNPLNFCPFRGAHEGESIHGWDTTRHPVPYPAQRQVCHEVYSSGKILLWRLIVLKSAKELF